MKKMKKWMMVLVSGLFVMMLYGSVSAFTVNFDLSPDIDFSQLSGFQFDISGSGDLDAIEWSPGPAMPVVAAGMYPWFVGRTAEKGFYVYDVTTTISMPFSAGTVMILTGDSPFTLSNFVFSSSLYADGKYPQPLQITEAPWDGGEGVTYTASAAVPIPGAAWLLGSGLVGLFAWSKRKSA